MLGSNHMKVNIAFKTETSKLNKNQKINSLLESLKVTSDKGFI